MLYVLLAISFYIWAGLFFVSIKVLRNLRTESPYETPVTDLFFWPVRFIRYIKSELDDFFSVMR